MGETLLLKKINQLVIFIFDIHTQVINTKATLSNCIDYHMILMIFLKFPICNYSNFMKLIQMKMNFQVIFIPAML